MWTRLPHLASRDVAQFFPRTLLEVAATSAHELKPASTIVVQNIDFPAPAPNHRHDETIFAQSYGVPFTDAISTNGVWPASSTEILRTFSFPSRLIDDLRHRHLLASAVNLIPSSIPFQSAAAFARLIFDKGAFPFPNDDPRNHEHVINCFAYIPRTARNLSRQHSRGTAHTRKTTK